MMKSAVRRAIRSAILQATVVLLFSAILDHHFSKGFYDVMDEDQGFQMLLSALNFTDARDFVHTTGTTNEAGSSHGYSSRKGTGRTSRSKSHEPVSESFYGRALPRGALYLLISLTLQQYWYLWLEKKFPAWPMQRFSEPQEHSQYRADRKVTGSEDGEEGDDGEGEVIKRWIEQGRIQRASLNWGNTVVKWILDLTVGTMWKVAVSLLFTLLAAFQNPFKVAKLVNWVCSSFLNPWRVTILFYRTQSRHQTLTDTNPSGLVCTVLWTYLSLLFLSSSHSLSSLRIGSSSLLALWGCSPSAPIFSSKPSHFQLS